MWAGAASVAPLQAPALQLLPASVPNSLLLPLPFGTSRPSSTGVGSGACRIATMAPAGLAVAAGLRVVGCRRVARRFFRGQYASRCDQQIADWMGCNAVPMVATSAGPAGHSRNAPAVPWPDLRFWVWRLPDGNATVEREPGPGAEFVFDAYSQHFPGTREVRLGNFRFFAFTAPRRGAEHLVVWRRTADVHSAAQRWLGDGVAFGRSADCRFDPSHALRVVPFRRRTQLTAAVWCWDRLDVRDPDRYWDGGDGTGPWMYWESFWAPSESAACASMSPAFGDVEGLRLQYLDPVGATSVPIPDSATTARVTPTKRLDQEEERVVESTATATAAKDRAYSIVYQYNVWGSDVSRSGTGSDLWSPEARLAVTAIEAVLHRFDIKSILDCACGDATWMVPFFVARHPEIQYRGVDIVSDVIEQNRQRHPGVDFEAMDLAEARLPTGADMIFSKETINHMGLEDAMSTIQRFRETGARYLLTNVHEGSVNEEGYDKKCFTTYIKYDYELPPFNMKKITRLIEYQGLHTSFCLFDLTQA